MPMTLMQNTCPEEAIIKACEIVLNLPDVRYDISQSENDLQLDLTPMLKNTPGIILKEGLSGKSEEELAKVIKNLKPDFAYIWRTGTNLTAGHFHVAYYDKGQLKLYSGPNRLYSITNIDGTINKQGAEELLNRGANWGPENTDQCYTIYELNYPRIIALANYVADCRKVKTKEEREIAEITIPENVVNNEDDDYFIKIKDYNYWQNLVLPLFPEDKIDLKKQVLTNQLVYSGEPKALQRLLKLDVDINEQNLALNNDTLLHQAVRNNSVQAVQALIKNGANIYLKNDQDLTPSMLMDELVRENKYTVEGTFVIRNLFLTEELKGRISNDKEISLDELKPLLLLCFNNNNYIGIKLLLTQQNAKNIDIQSMIFNALIPLARKFNLTWDTIKDSLRECIYFLEKNGKLQEAIDVLDKCKLVKLTGRSLMDNYVDIGEDGKNKETWAERQETMRQKLAQQALQPPYESPASATQLLSDAFKNNDVEQIKLLLNGDRANDIDIQKKPYEGLKSFAQKNSTTSEEITPSLREYILFLEKQNKIKEAIDVIDECSKLNLADKKLMKANFDVNRVWSTKKIELNHKLKQKPVATIIPPEQAKLVTSGVQQPLSMPTPQNVGTPNQKPLPPAPPVNTQSQNPRPTKPHQPKPDAKFPTPKEQAKAKLTEIIEDYIKVRVSKNKTYFWGGVFSFLSNSKSVQKKKNAVTALKDALNGTHRINDDELATLRNGELGKKIREFVKTGEANKLDLGKLNTVRDLVSALNANYDQMHQSSSKPQ